MTFVKKVTKNQLFLPLFSMVLVMLTMARSSSERINEILEEQSDLHLSLIHISYCTLPMLFMIGMRMLANRCA